MPAFLLFWISLGACAQTNARPDPAPPSTHALHADVVHFIEVSGARKAVAGSMEQSIADGKKQFAKQCPTCTPAYVEEWSKRMGERMSVDTVMQVFVTAYEKFLNDDDIRELTTLQQAANAGRSVTPSAALQAKLTKVMPALQAEVVHDCAALGATLGEQIAKELDAEHPEMRSAKPAPKPVKP